MSWLEGLALLRPWWLAAIPLALLLWLRRRRIAAGLGAWARAMDPAMMAAMAALGRVRPGDGRGLWPPALAMALVALALAGPARRDDDAAALRNLDGMALLLDLSPSMTADGPPQGAVAAARVVMDGAGTRGVGLIVYAGDAYLAAPFTVDHAALSRSLGGLDGETVPDPGSRPALAVARAQAQFAAAGIVAGDAVLISDGGGVDAAAIEAAGELRRSGGRLWTIYAPSPPAAEDATPPDPAALRRLAEAGGGEMAEATGAVALAERLGAGFDARLRRAGLAALAWEEWGRGLLALALVPTLLMFRRAGRGVGSGGGA